jgi:MscS family membrane protein
MMTDEVSTKFQWIYELLTITFFVLVFNFIIRELLKKLEKHFKEKKLVWKERFISALILPLSIFVWLFSVIYVSLLLDSRINDPPLLKKATILLPTSFVLLLTWFAFRWKKEVIQELKKNSHIRSFHLDASKVDAIDKIATITILFISLVSLLAATGRSTGALLTFGGIGAAAIGFASKEFIANFFGGFMIYLTKPFAIADMIKLPQKEIVGYVEEIGWYMTRIRDIEKQPIYIPNALFSDSIVITPTQRSHRLIKETAGVRYQDFGQVKQIISEIKQFLNDHPDFDSNERQMVHLASYGQSSLDIEINTYTKLVDLKDYNDIKQELLFKVYDIVVKNNADFAYTTMTLDLPQKIL